MNNQEKLRQNAWYQNPTNFFSIFPSFPLPLFFIPSLSSFLPSRQGLAFNYWSSAPTSPALRFQGYNATLGFM